MPSAFAVSAQLAAVDGTALQPTGLAGLYQVQAGSAGQRLIDQLAGKPYINYIEPLHQVRATLTPNDPQFADGTLWGLNGAHGINAPGAWDTTTGSPAVVVADIDTGIDYNHPDLYDNIWINQPEIPASRAGNLHHFDANGNIVAGPITFYDLNYFNAVSQTYPDQGPGKITDVNGDGVIDAGDLLMNMIVDGSGNDTGAGGWVNSGKPNTQDGDTAHPDDLVGWNFVNNTNKPFDDNRHGTHTGGTIGGVGNNGAGVVGVNWQTEIMPLKFLDNTGSGSDLAGAQAVEYAIAHGARVTSNSWGDTVYSQTLFDAIADANSAGVIFVAAAGNFGSNNDTAPFYPADFDLPNVVAVAATASSGSLATFSDYGQVTVGLGAPGVSIYSTLPNKNYGYLSGTSMATPHVAGTMALVLAEHPGWSARRVIEQILNSTTPDAALAGKTVTGGLLNAANATLNPAVDLNWTNGGISGPTLTAYPGTFTISRTYAVSGAAAPASFTLSYYASTSSDPNQNLARDGIFLGSETISSASDLSVGTHSGTSPALQIASGGTFYLFAFLDSGRQTLEADDSNNVAVAPKQLVAVAPAVIDFGSQGYSETGSWTSWSTITAYGGAYRYAPSSGNGNNTATWQLTGLPAGVYSVQAAWAAFANQATSAPYAIFDGTTLLGTVAVNQTQAPSGTSFGGVPFQLLGSFNITSGNLKVVVSNTGANGSYIAADAVRLAPVPVSNTDLNWSATGDGITGPTSVSTQATFTINRTYTVSGAAAPGAFTIAYSASTSSSPTQNLSQASLLGTESISAAADLAVGNHTGVSPAFQIGSNGSYYLLAVLNSNSSFVETDGTNNLTVSAQPTAASGPVLIDNGQPGYSETGTWLNWSTATAYGGAYHYASSGGNNSATWQVSGLAAGLYSVQAAWPAFANQATNAPYAVYDGATLLQTVPVNQTLVPSGSSFGGVPFQTLGTFNVTSGTLKVVLSSSGANGSYIAADAVRIALVPVSNTDLNWAASGDGITGPSSVSTQSTFAISRTYTVSAAAAPSAFTITYYASTSSSTTQNLSQATLLGSESISATGDLSVGNHTGTSPAFQITSNGAYYLFAVLNPNSTFVETDNTNNLAVTAQPTTVSGPVVIDNGQPGHSETGSWLGWSTTTAYGGAYRYASSNGTGNNTATWQVSGLATGSYTVQVSWPAYANQATNAPYSIYDGNTLVTTVLIDQTLTPIGSTYGGVPFQGIATVAIASGTLKVVVSNTANGSYVAADAVRIAPLNGGQSALQLSTLPSTANSIGIFSDQLPTGMSNALVQFIATHEAGTQKMMLADEARFKAVNANWVQLHYRLATASGPLPYIHNNTWSSDWSAVTANESWFMHNAAGQRLSSSASNWNLHDINNPTWRQYWLNNVVNDMIANGSQGVFADAFTAGTGAAWFNEFDARFAGANAANPSAWPNGVTWLQQLTSLSNYMETALSTMPQHFLYMPNIGDLVTSWANQDFSPIDGGMLENFGNWGGGYLQGGDPSNWTLAMNRALTLTGQDKALIMQPTLFDQPGTGNSALQREFLMGTYFLLKGNHTYINIMTPTPGINAYYLPEYQINLGAAITPLAASVSQYLWNNVYRRDFQNGIVLVNPSNSTYTITLPQTYQQVTGTGGGVLGDASLDASGNYIGGALHKQAVTQVTLAPGSAAILLNS